MAEFLLASGTDRARPRVTQKLRSWPTVARSRVTAWVGSLYITHFELDLCHLQSRGWPVIIPLLNVSPAAIPVDRGTYAVLRPVELGPSFLPVNLGKDLKSYGFWDLHRRWVGDAEVIYIGKAGGATGLRGRLRPFSRMARNHSGGRSIWQLEHPEALKVAWLPTREYSAEEVERHLVAAFYVWYGQRPFANLSMPRQAQGTVDLLSNHPAVWERWADFQRQANLRLEQVRRSPAR